MQTGTRQTNLMAKSLDKPNTMRMQLLAVLVAVVMLNSKIADARMIDSEQHPDARRNLLDVIEPSTSPTTQHPGANTRVPDYEPASRLSCQASRRYATLRIASKHMFMRRLPRPMQWVLAPHYY